MKSYRSMTNSPDEWSDCPLVKYAIPLMVRINSSNLHFTFVRRSLCVARDPDVHSLPIQADLPIATFLRVFKIAERYRAQLLASIRAASRLSSYAQQPRKRARAQRTFCIPVRPAAVRRCDANRFTIGD